MTHTHTHFQHGCINSTTQYAYFCLHMLTCHCIDTVTVVISDYCSTSCHFLVPILLFSLLSAVCTLQIISNRMDQTFHEHNHVTHKQLD